ncbi:MAG TPA: electron transfer flavoprotein-ubiquinone oxidoreductase [Alphaproteobacteria bacterium]|nr:electron transfer flavoprotein-ubiquinone oxidoreductase [Alphaproteobacteria bacterium]
MERESMQFDVVIVGAGPAGLAAAIRFKQLCAGQGKDFSVCVVEKGSEVGAHILSGAVIDPIALNELIPGWKERGAPLNTEVADDRFLILSERGQLRIPNIFLPPLMHNDGNYIVSLGNLCRWLAAQAEELGVEIFPGFAAAEALYGEDGRVKGIATGDMGVGRNGEHKANYTPGVELHGKYTLLAEGVRGSLAKNVMGRFNLREGADPQKFGIGLKELWQVDASRHKPGLVIHSQGWPLDSKTGGGSFIYHLEDRQVAIGFVVHLDYRNPYLSPYDEFQRFKTHPAIRPMLEGGKRLSYGARAISEGGLQSVPKLVFPGGALIGCAAGFVNLPRIKGSHNAMKTGMLAAEAAFASLSRSADGREPLTAYQEAYRKSWVYQDLHRVRNVKPGLKWGMWLGTLHGGIHMWLNNLGLGFLVPWTLHHKKADHETLEPAARSRAIAYPKPDGVVTFDKMSSVYLSNTNHEEDQPVHLKLADPAVAIRYNLALFDAPEQRYCPAGVYEIVGEGEGKPRLQINAQNCVHCKTCDIKDPLQNINWVVPEGGGGPNYPNM